MNPNGLGCIQGLSQGESNTDEGGPGQLAFGSPSLSRFEFASTQNGTERFNDFVDDEMQQGP